MKHLEAWRSPRREALRKKRRRQSLQLARFRHGTWTSQHRDFTFLAEATIFAWRIGGFIHGLSITMVEIVGFLEIYGLSMGI